MEIEIDIYDKYEKNIMREYIFSYAPSNRETATRYTTLSYAKYKKIIYVAHIANALRKN